MTEPPPVVRQALLDATLPAETGVERVSVMRVELAAAQSAGLHLHLCPVVGWVVSGLVRFQVADGPVVLLRAGDAFFGPANVPIPQVDNSSQTEAAVFIACYLLPPGEDRLIEMSEQRRRPSREHGLVSRTEDRLIRRWTRDRCRGVGSAGLWAEKRGAVVIQGSGEGRATETGPSPNLYPADAAMSAGRWGRIRSKRPVRGTCVGQSG